MNEDRGHAYHIYAPGTVPPQTYCRDCGAKPDTPDGRMPCPGRVVRFRRVMHVYGAEQWHDPVFVVGDRPALLELAQAVAEALETGAGVVRECFATDGEGYNVHVLCRDPMPVDLAPHYADRESTCTESLPAGALVPVERAGKVDPNETTADLTTIV